MRTAQLTPLPLTVSCSSKIQIGFTFLVLAHPTISPSCQHCLEIYIVCLLKNDCKQNQQSIKAYKYYIFLQITNHDICSSTKVTIFIHSYSFNRKKAVRMQLLQCYDNSKRHTQTLSVWQSVPSAMYASDGQYCETPSQYSPRSHAASTTSRHSVAIGFTFTNTIIIPHSFTPSLKPTWSTNPSHHRLHTGAPAG